MCECHDFRTTIELVVENSGGEILRTEVFMNEEGYVDLHDMKNSANRDLVSALSVLSIGDTIKVVERETEG